jgi:hypothetical protein
VSRQECAEYRARFEALKAWEARQPAVERDPGEIVADLGFLLGFVSEEDRLRDPDPEKLGIQRMRAILALEIGSK